MSSVAVQSYDAQRKCLGASVTVDACVMLPSPRVKGVSTICGLAPAGGVFAGTLMEQGTISTTSWTFARAYPGTTRALDGSVLTPEEQGLCATLPDEASIALCP